jgi:osmoprotectant transport system substrate-binding protein
VTKVLRHQIICAASAIRSAAPAGRELTALVRNCGEVAGGTIAGVFVPAVLGGCQLRAPRQFPSGTALFDAMRAGVINTAWTTTADPDVPDDVVVLAINEVLLSRSGRRVLRPD